MKIDKDVKIPDGTSDALGFKKYRFEDMSVGDSSLFDRKSSGPRKAADRCAKKTGMKFLSRTTSDGLRIWRIK